MTWLDEMFGVKKPIIALLHLHALPGDPKFDGNMDAVISQAQYDLEALQKGGVDGVLIANEMSMPYQPKTDYVTVGSLAYIVGLLRRDISIPFGVNIVMNQEATLDLAAATGANFIRSAFTGAYMGEYGTFASDPAYILRRKKALGLDNLRMLYKVNPEGDAYLVQRDIKAIVKSIKFSCDPDGLCVSGASAGSEASTDIMQEVKSVAGDVPVFCNTGFNAASAREKFAVADAACVGTAFKKDGKFENDVDPARVVEIMNVVKQIRAEL